MWFRIGLGRKSCHRRGMDRPRLRDFLILKDMYTGSKEETLPPRRDRQADLAK